MLIAILALAFVHFNATGVWTFNYEELLKTPMSHGVEYMLMLGFFIAFAVKNAGSTAARLATGRPLPGTDGRFRRPRGHLAEKPRPTVCCALRCRCSRTPPPSLRQSPCGWA